MLDPKIVHELLDREQIRELQVLYVQRDADRDVDGWSALFAEDGTYINPRGSAFVGRAAVRKNLADRVAANAPDRRTAHLCGPALITLHGETAESVSDYVAYGRLGPNSPWYIAAIGRIHNQLVKLDGKWLFKVVRNEAYFPEILPFPSADYQGGVAAVDKKP